MKDIIPKDFDEEEDGVPFARFGSLVLFLDQAERPAGPVLDFIVEDTEKARDLLVEKGCEVVKWDESGKYLRDPFGLTFNLATSPGGC